MANTPYLTIKPQYSYHDDVVITGTKESFEDLFGRLKKLLYFQDGSVVTDTMFNVDGEGFEVKLHIKPEENFKDTTLEAKYYGEICPHTGKPTIESEVPSPTVITKEEDNIYLAETNGTKKRVKKALPNG
jgi:hypothetical protein